jgi:hypothetical protein
MRLDTWFLSGYGQVLQEPHCHLAYVAVRQHTSAYVSIRQHTSAYVSIRQHTSTTVRYLGSRIVT